ncbi:MAG: hypothetical protein JW915_14895 [Chitinispirillaceae bacterium]|nr:hypothetical protein [Chitinispirillaceae bacterium]
MNKHYSIRKILNQNNGNTLVTVMMIAIFAAMILQSLAYSTRSTLKASGRKLSKVASLNIAEAGKEQVIADLRERTLNLQHNKKIFCYNNEPFGGGAFTVTCSTTTMDTAVILSIGYKGNDTSKIEVVAYINPDSWQRWVKGAVTARTSVNTLGKIEIDGRDYDTSSFSGTCLGTGGVVGVAAGGSVTVDNSSSGVGGNYTSPQKAVLEGETACQNIDTTGYPQTPEDLLGMTSAQLEAYKWTTPPPSDYVGIVYSETPYDFAGGIMILHNSSGTASLGNYNGNFKGLIIADEVKHFNAGSTVLGAIFMLGKTSGGNCFGNGTAKIHYSSQMLEKVTKFIPVTERRTVNVASWREVN